MKTVLVVLILGVAGALAVADRAGREPRPRPIGAVTVAPPAKIVASEGDDRIAAADPRTQKRTVPPVPAADVARGVLSPSGLHVALTHREPGQNFIRVFDLAGNRMGRRIALGGEGNASHLTWLSDTRLALFTSWISERATLVEIDVAHQRVVRRHPTRSFPVAAARSEQGLIALMAPPGRIGGAKLLTPNGTFPLDGIRAGIDRTREVTRSLWPALAVDAENDTAYVISAEHDRFGRIDIVTGISTVGLPFGAVAKSSKLIDSRRRSAAWLGDGRIAVSGSNDTPDGRIEPYGLRIVGVNGQRQFMLAPEQSTLAAHGRRALAWGDGLSIFQYGGTLERRVLKGTQISHVELLGHLAYAHADRRTYVVDIRTGKVVTRTRRPGLRARPAAKRRPVLGVRYDHGPAGRISHFDPVTLKRIGRSAVVNGHLWASARRGRRAALAVSNRGRVQLFAADPVRRARTIETGRRESLIGLRWVRDDRLLAVTFDHALELDLEGVVARRPLGGHPLATAPTTHGLLVLVGPQDGDAWLLHLVPGSAPRRIDLPRVRARQRAGHDLRPEDPPELYPGLAAGGDTAYVADARAARIVRVDLLSGGATSHPLAAGAAKGGAARTRRLQPLPGGRLLLTAQDLSVQGIERRSTQLVETAGWRLRTLTSGSADAVASPEGIVLPDFRRRRVDILDPAGGRLARLRIRYGISAVRVHGPYAYVMNGARRGANHRTHVLDLRTGRMVETLRFTTLPHLLAP